MSNSAENGAETPYHGPVIVPIGEALAVTGALSSGVRDNKDSLEPPRYHNAEGDDPDETVDLDD